MIFSVATPLSIQSYLMRHEYFQHCTHKFTDGGFNLAEPVWVGITPLSISTTNCIPVYRVARASILLIWGPENERE